MRIDDEMLMAFLDGELQGAERDAVERALQDDPQLRAKLESQQSLRTTLKAHYGPVAVEAIPDRLLALLGAAPPSAGDASGASLAAARERRRTPAWRNLAAIAATLAVGIVAGHLIPARPGSVVAEDGRLVARGSLATALQTQLASAQSPGETPRIGVSFEDRSGRFCRSFDDAALSGLACREDGRWQLVMTAAREDRFAGQYRQAGSTLVLQAAQEMMADAPLDAKAEEAAMRAGWTRPGR
jgi:hypothetical protein